MAHELVGADVGLLVTNALDELGETADGAGVALAAGSSIGLRVPEALLRAAFTDRGAAASWGVAYR